MKVQVAYDTESDGEVLALEADDLIVMGYTPIEVSNDDNGCNATYEIKDNEFDVFDEWLDNNSNWSYFGIYKMD